MSDADDDRPNKRLKRDPDDDMSDDDDDDDDGEEVIGKDGKKTKGKGGSSCHQCKSRRNFTALTYCTSNLDKKNKKCRKKFCGHCLKKFYKETAQAIADKGNWKCPSCRKICCCAACRRRKTKEVGKDDSPVHKVKKSSSHKSSSHRHYDSHGHGDRNRGGGYHDGEHYHGGHGDEDGYSHRRDRSLLHSSHSPGMMGGDNPMRGGSYDMMDGQQREEYSSDNQHSYSDSDSDSDDSDSDDGGGSEQNVHTGGAQHYMHDDDPQASLPSSQFTSLLSAHIKALAEESARTPNTPFARLYKQAQASRIKKKIKSILLRPDLKKEKKVELIAGLLAPLEEGGGGGGGGQTEYANGPAANTA